MYSCLSTLGQVSIRILANLTCPCSERQLSSQGDLVSSHSLWQLLSYAQPYFLHHYQGQWLPTYPRKWRTTRSQFLTSLLCAPNGTASSFYLPTPVPSLLAFLFSHPREHFCFLALFFSGPICQLGQIMRRMLSLVSWNLVH